MKRGEQYAAAKHKAKLAHSKEKKKRKREAELLGEDAPPKQVARTLDNTREADDTIVDADDDEVTVCCVVFSLMTYCVRWKQMKKSMNSLHSLKERPQKS